MAETADTREPDDLPLAERIAQAKAFLRRHQALRAYDLLVTAPAEQAGDVALRQRKALALCELHDPGHALEILTALRAEGHDDEETIGLLGRAWKDAALAAASPGAREERLARAFEAYREGHERFPHRYWLGVNAGTISLLRGRAGDAARFAEEAEARCRARLREEKAPEERYWLLATLGECALLRGRDDEALDRYGEAGAIGAREWRNLKSTRRNLRLILRARHDPVRAEEAWAPFARALPIPPVAVAVGHRIDAPGRKEPRFPPAREAAVKEAIRAWIRETGAGFGVASAAAGTDLLFLEAMLEEGGEVQVLLPYPAPDFVEDSVTYEDEAWRPRFDAALKGSDHVALAALHRFEEGSPSFEYANAFLDGMGILRAEDLDTPVVRLAVWNGRPGDGPGGTAHMARRWVERGASFSVIDPLRPETGARPFDGRTPLPPAPPQPREARILTILFGDAVGFSRLSESGVARFVDRFLPAVADVLDRHPGAVLMKETWGDGLLVVSEDVGAAGRLAMDLSERMGQTDWTRHGLPAEMTMRLALHAGPARVVVDPVTKRERVYGTHVSHGARIEPITPPGSVYASESFAVLAAEARAKGFACSYVGLTPWAKNYGTLATYHVHRAGP